MRNRKENRYIEGSNTNKMAKKRFRTTGIKEKGKRVGLRVSSYETKASQTL